MPLLRPLLTAAAALAALAAGCSRPAEPVAAQPELACLPLSGLEPLLSDPAGHLLVIGADNEAGVAAFLRVVCAAAARGERVRAGLDGLEGAAREQIAAWIASGADIEIAALPAGDDAPLADRGAREAALAAALLALGDGADRAIALVDADSAARRMIGLAGETWSPAAAQLPGEASVSLLATAGGAGAGRIDLAPFEDIPDVGAARAYDGVIEVEAPAAAAEAEPDDSLRGRQRT